MSSTTPPPPALTGTDRGVRATLAAKARILRGELLYGPLIALIGVAFTVRVVTMGMYYPAIMTLADSPRFARIDPTSLFGDFYMPAVYPAFLQVLHAVSDQVWFTIAIQHLGGIAVGICVFLAVRRIGVRPAIACIPAGCVLLSGDHIYLEHVFMADWLLIGLSTAGLAAGVRGLVPEIDLRWLAVAGALLAAAGLTRSVGIVLPLVLAFTAAVLASGVIRRRLIAAGVVLAGAGAVVAIYFGAFLISDGKYAGLNDFAGWNLYSRVAPFADCSRFDPPAGTDVLCDDVAADQRPGPFGYVWDPRSIARRNFEPMGPQTGGPLGDFARQAILHQPLDYLGAVGKDLVRFFDPSVGASRPLSGQSPELISFGFRDPVTEQNVVAALDQRYDGVALQVGGEHVLGAYQDIFRVDKLLLVACLLLTLVGMALTRGALRLGTVLFGLSALALYIVPVATNSYDFRYGIPPETFLIVSATLGACGLAVRYLAAGPRSVLQDQP